MGNVLILYSGGADSRLMLELASKMNYNINCLLIDYGQLHKEELQVALEQLRKCHQSSQIVKIDGLNVNSGLTGDGVKNDTGEVHEMHVPGRNSIFLSIAFSIAEYNNIDTIWIGCDWSDRLNLFPDCYQEYIVRINKLFEIAGPKPIKVEAPLMGLSKENILKLLNFYGISTDDIYSGYGNL